MPNFCPYIPGVDFMNFFVPYALAPNFCASKKLLKKLGVGIGRKWIELTLWFVPCAQLLWNQPQTLLTINTNRSSQLFFKDLLPEHQKGFENCDVINRTRGFLHWLHFYAALVIRQPALLKQWQLYWANSKARLFVMHFKFAAFWNTYKTNLVV